MALLSIMFLRHNPILDVRQKKYFAHIISPFKYTFQFAIIQISIDIL